MTTNSGTVSKTSHKGGLIANTVNSINRVIKTFLGKLSTKELYWSLIKYLGEALSIAFFKSIGEVIFGMGDVLKGESSWYKRNLSTPGSTSAASSAFSSSRPSFSSGSTTRPMRSYTEQELSFPVV